MNKPIFLFEIRIELALVWSLSYVYFFRYLTFKILTFAYDNIKGHIQIYLFAYT